MKKTGTLALIALLTIAADQWTKHLVRLHLQGPREYANGLLTLILTQNSGAFLSLGSTLPEVVRTLIFSLVVAVGLVVASWIVLTGRMSRRSEELAMAFVIGGGVGNLIDRFFFHGHVTDFLYLSAGPLHTGVFNVADMAITGGVIFLLVVSMMKRPLETPPAGSD